MYKLYWDKQYANKFKYPLWQCPKREIKRLCIKHGIPFWNMEHFFRNSKPKTWNVPEITIRNVPYSRMKFHLLYITK